MARRKEGVLDLLVELPWWVSVVVSGVCYLVLAKGLPNAGLDSPFFKTFVPGLKTIAPFLSIILLLPAIPSYLHSRRKAGLVDSQVNVKSIQKLSWREFEELIAEVFRRRGYAVTENIGIGPDGGVDVRLEKDGKQTIVQCKHWKKSSVGVPIVREMFGIMTAEEADSVMVISSGYFTKEAKSFAEGLPIHLIDGEHLARLVGEAQNNSSTLNFDSVIDSTKIRSQSLLKKTLLKAAFFLGAVTILPIFFMTVISSVLSDFGSEQTQNLIETNEKARSQVQSPITKPVRVTAPPAGTPVTTTKFQRADDKERLAELQRQKKIRIDKAFDSFYQAPADCDSWTSNCLLYTSPSPRDATLSRMPSSA